ncbi:hypothetical protein SPHINGOAX6_70735 [Sphingomonas sp. AX6]|nr:hypothetical protein SPHINGOAX6_70735 [Sphingomonas sp. AX6]
MRLFQRRKRATGRRDPHGTAIGAALRGGTHAPASAPPWRLTAFLKLHRHCERSEAIRSDANGLLRCARNDVGIGFSGLAFFRVTAFG